MRSFLRVELIDGSIFALHKLVLPFQVHAIVYPIRTKQLRTHFLRGVRKTFTVVEFSLRGFITVKSGFGQGSLSAILMRFFIDERLQRRVENVDLFFWLALLFLYDGINTPVPVWLILALNDAKWVRYYASGL